MKRVNNVYFFSCLFITLFIFAAVSFSFHQNLWVDESTQLSGLSLSFSEIYLWLGGLLDNPFPIPTDRMPVLSYWTGLLWIEMFGLNILTLRYLSIVFVILALSLLAYYFFKNKNNKVLLASLAILCFSPNLVVFSVEIRAYALFLLLSMIAAILYVDIIQSAERGDVFFKKIIYLSLALALSINTHFFGFLLSGSILSAYLLMALIDKRFVFNLRIFLSVSMIFIVAIALASPALYASFVVSHGDAIAADSSWLRPAVRLIYRLVAHQSMLEISFLPIVALAVFYGVILFSLIYKASLTKVALLLVLGLGFSVAFVANFFMQGFDALSIHYNIWMLPFTALLFGFSVADLSTIKQRIIVGVLCLLFGFGQYNLITSGKKYAHTRFNEIVAQVDSYSEQFKVAVIYNKAAAKTWFAGLYYFHEDIGQYSVEDKVYTNLNDQQTIPQHTIEATYDVIISVYGENIYSKDLVGKPVQSPLSIESPVYQQISLPSKWKILNTGAYLAQESADIIVYQKTP